MGDCLKVSNTQRTLPVPKHFVDPTITGKSRLETGKFKDFKPHTMDKVEKYFLSSLFFTKKTIEEE